MPEQETEIENIFTAVHNALDVKIDFKPDKDTGKIKPHFNVDDCLGKFMGLMVYVGWIVPVNSMPNYNSVHANVEYWKRHFEKPSPELEAKKDEASAA